MDKLSVGVVGSPLWSLRLKKMQCFLLYSASVSPFCGYISGYPYVPCNLGPGLLESNAGWNPPNLEPQFHIFLKKD